MNYTVSTVPFNFVPMPMVNNTVLVMSETTCNSTLSKENNSKRKNNAYIGEYRKKRKTDKDKEKSNACMREYRNI